MAGFGQDITDHRQSVRDIKRLSDKLLDVQDQERRRIARELHDSTAQHLVARGRPDKKDGQGGQEFRSRSEQPTNISCQTGAEIVSNSISLTTTHGEKANHLKEIVGAQGRSRTADTAIFSRMLYQLSYLGIPARREGRAERAGYRISIAACPYGWTRKKETSPGTSPARHAPTRSWSPTGPKRR